MNDSQAQLSSEDKRKLAHYRALKRTPRFSAPIWRNLTGKEISEATTFGKAYYND